MVLSGAAYAKPPEPTEAEVHPEAELQPREYRAVVSARRRRRERVIEGLLFLSASGSVVTTALVIIILLEEALQFFRKVPLSTFLTDTQWTPLFYDKHYGILPLVAGTFLTSGIAMLVALPVGLAVAVYLSEFARPATRSIIKPLMELLAGIPTVVYGYIALLMVTPFLQRLLPDVAGFNALSAGIVMGLMILPLVVSLAEDALYGIPTSLRDAAYALGATRLQMVWRVLLPAAAGGISAAFILALSRAVGETMIVAIAAGQVPNLTLDPRNSVETMTAFIVQVSLGDTPHGTMEYRTIFAVGAALFALTSAMNALSLYLKGRFGRFGQ